MRLARHGEYRGIEFSVPITDDGCWRFVLYPKNHQIRKWPAGISRRQTYASCELAVEGARQAIEAIFWRSEERVAPAGSENSGHDAGDRE